MRRISNVWGLLALVCTGCMTHIVTVAPDYGTIETHSTYSTTVTVPKKHTTVVTTGTFVAAEDISLCLDMHAVAAAFAQSSTVKEFEHLLNNASYMLSNLDLNRDGYVDYLRVMERMEGYAHVFVIQAVLAPNVFQDVATLVAEVSSIRNAYVQVVGSPYIFGPNYIIQPVFAVTPVIYAHLIKKSYNHWNSPWYWDHFPSYYKHPAPVYVSHYQAYVNTFIGNHYYCREVTYVDRCLYKDYDRVSRPVQRNDYANQHPEQSFKVRTADIPVQSQSREINARDVRELQRASAQTSTTTGRTSERRTADVTSSTNQNVRTAETPAGSTAAQTQTSSVRRQSSAQTQPSSTQSQSAVTERRPAAVQTQQSSSKEPVSASNQQTTPERRAASARTQSSGTASSSGSVQQQTTVRSRVSNSGSSETKTSTVSTTGDAATVRRGSSEEAAVRRSSSTQSPTVSSSSATSSGSSSSETTPRRAASAENGNAVRNTRTDSGAAATRR